MTDPSPSRAPVLVADIGGTRSRLALADGQALRRDTLRTVRNDAFPDLATVLARYVEGAGLNPAAVCLAAAGPVAGDRVRLTNRDWQITTADIAAATGCHDITLINDLQALGYALAVPDIAGSPLHQTRLVLAIGTGLNAAVAHLTPGGVFVPPGEHGYVTLPATKPEDAPLLDALSRDFGAPVIEAALSGPGLTRTHQILTGERRAPEDITAGVAGTEATLAAVLRLLGACLGSLALTHLPHGGIYLAGAGGRALFPHLGHAAFRQHFTGRGSYSELASSFPLRMVEDDAAPLHGAAFHLAHR